MIRNYVKIGFRNVTRNKQYTFINIVGLSLGLAVVLFIALWVWNAFQYNKGFKNYSSIGQIMVTGTYSGIKSTDPVCSPPFANTLRNQYGNFFRHVTLATHPVTTILGNKDKKLEETGIYADREFMPIFQPKMLKGNYWVTDAEKTVLIAESLSKQLFGSNDPIGQSLTINGNSVLQVGGVYEDFPDQSSFYKSIQYIAPLDTYLSTLPYSKEELWQSWNLNMFMLYVQIPSSTTFEQVSQKIKNIASIHETDIKPEIFVDPMSRWHLYSTFKDGKNIGGMIDIVYLFIGIGLGILLLAITNFINLATAQSASRTIEVGVRKVIGANRKSLITQFLIESLILVFISGLVALMLTIVALPIFNSLSDSSFSLNFSYGAFGVFYLIGLLLIGFLAGIYPAFYLSSFQTIKVLKGLSIGRGKNILRKSLIICQFFIATVLVFMTLLVWRQISFAKSRPVGYTINGLVYFNTKDSILIDHFDAFRMELLHAGVAKNAAIATAPVYQLRMSNGGYSWNGEKDNTKAIFGTTYISPDFAATVGWQFLKGRNYSVYRPADSLGIILNLAAANYIGKEAQLGHTINYRGTDFTILGIIANPVMGGPFEKISPAAFFLNNGHGDYISIKLNPEISTSVALTKIADIHKKYSPNYPLNLLFVDSSYQRAFRDIERSAKMISIFSLLAILIAILGLFALSSYAIEQKKKEIGIRKVLGASIFELWTQFVKEFLLLILFSFIVAIPVSLVLMRNWLSSFDYRTTISPYLFLFGMVVSVFVAILAISTKVLSAVKVNPVNNLRSE